MQYTYTRINHLSVDNSSESDKEKSINILFEAVRENITLIVIVVGIIIGYANLQSRVSVTEESISNLQAEMIENQKTLSGFSNDITYIKTTLDYIKSQLINK